MYIHTHRPTEIGTDSYIHTHRQTHRERERGPPYDSLLKCSLLFSSLLFSSLLFSSATLLSDICFPSFLLPPSIPHSLSFAPFFECESADPSAFVCVSLCVCVCECVCVSACADMWAQLWRSRGVTAPQREVCALNLVCGLLPPFTLLSPMARSD